MTLPNSLRRLPFTWCAVAALLLHGAVSEVLFSLAATNAFINLFTTQMNCASGACAAPADPPHRVIRLINHGTSVIGAGFLLYALRLGLP